MRTYDPSQVDPVVLTTMFFGKLIRQVHELHTHQVAHGAISKSNIVVNDMGELELGDFSHCYAVKMNNNNTLCEEMKQVPSKHIQHHPAEVEWFLADRLPFYHPLKADIWYLGSVLMEMVYGLIPTPHRDADKREFPERGDKNFKWLLAQMLSPDPS